MRAQPDAAVSDGSARGGDTSSGASLQPGYGDPPLLPGGHQERRPTGTENSHQCWWGAAAPLDEVAGPQDPAVTLGGPRVADDAPLLVLPSLVSEEDETVDARMLAVVAARLGRAEEGGARGAGEGEGGDAGDQPQDPRWLAVHEG